MVIPPYPELKNETALLRKELRVIHLIEAMEVILRQNHDPKDIVNVVRIIRHVGNYYYHNFEENYPQRIEAINTKLVILQKSVSGCGYINYDAANDIVTMRQGLQYLINYVSGLEDISSMFEKLEQLSVP